jgi:hypothetical protein
VVGLPALLRNVEAADPGVRVEARRLVKLIVADFHAAHAPAGMRVVPGRIVVGDGWVACDGGFYLGRKEVTLGEFRRFARERDWPLERWEAGHPDLPVTDVTLVEARAYALSVGARLPSQEELIEAATSGGSLCFPWGASADPSRANTRESGRGVLVAGGVLQQGASAHGICDLLGNAAEWTDTPAGRTYFCVVGGSYRTELRPAGSRAFRTYRLAGDARLPDVGFRLAQDLPALPREVRPQGVPGAARDPGAGGQPMGSPQGSPAGGS